MNLEEKYLSREEIYDGKILHVVKDTVLLPDGKEAKREFCMHVGAVCMLPLLPDGKVIMERQYRYPHGRVFLEIPAGKKDCKEEDSLSAALRELKEEVGAVPGKVTYLGAIDTSPAILDEVIDLYLCEELSFGDTKRDEDEFMALEEIPLCRLYEMVMKGEISDAKTQIAVLKVWNYLSNEK